jgi:hypothetical protein
VHHQDKVRSVASFFDPASGVAARAAILKEFDVQFVVQGPSERALGGLDLQDVPQLDVAYTSGEFRVYRVARR